MPPLVLSPSRLTISAVVGALLFLLALEPRSALAQQRVWFVPRIGYEIGLPLGIDRLPGLVNRFRSVGDGTGVNHTLFSGLGLRWDDPVGVGIGLNGSMALGVSLGDFTSDPYPSERLDTASGTLFTTQNRFTLASTLALLKFDLGVSVPIGDLLRASFGLVGSWRGSSGIIQREEIVSNDTLTFADGSRSRLVAAGEILGSSPFRFGLDLSLAARLPISESLELEPALFGRLDLTALQSGESPVRSLSGGVSLSLPFDLASSTLPLPPDNANDSARPRLAANVDLYSIERGDSLSTLTLRQQRTLHRRSIRIAPVILFDRDSNTIPGRYPRLTEVGAMTFALEELAGIDFLDLYRQTLNLVGVRMHTYERSVLRIGVGQFKGESSGPQRECGEAVRDYLNRIWGIPHSRIKLVDGTREGDSLRHRTINLYSEEILLEPIEIEWTVRGYAPPSIGLSHSIAPGVDVQSWSIAITRSGVEIARSSSLDGESLSGLSGQFRLTDDLDSNEASPLVADFTVIDLQGDTAHVRDTLPVVIQPLTDPDQIDLESFDGHFIAFGNEAHDDTDNQTQFREWGKGVGSTTRNRAEIRIWSTSNEKHTESPDVTALGAMLMNQAAFRRIVPSSLNIAPPADWTDPFVGNPEERLFRNGVFVRIEQSTGEEGR